MPINPNNVSYLTKSLYLTTGEPIDAKFKIQSLLYLNDISPAYVGHIFYSEDENNHYKITSVKDGYLDYQSNLIVPEQPMGDEYLDYEIVPNYFIDGYELLASGGGSSETPQTIKTKYESNANTNAYTDSEKTKLAGIEVGAQVNPTFKTVGGQSITGAGNIPVTVPFNIQSDSILTYTNLPTGLNNTTDVNKAYYVQSDKLVYVWDGTAFPTEGNGIDLRGDANPEDIVNEAFLQPVKLGWDTNYVSVATINTGIILCNNSFLPVTGTISVIEFNSPSAGNNITFKVGKFEGGTWIESSSHPFVMDLGVNILDVSIPVEQGEVLGILANGGPIGYTDGTDDRAYFENTGGNLNFHEGYLAYNYTYTSTHYSGAVEKLKELIDGDSPSNSLNTIYVDRIDIEGQSNALGVGFTSGLLVSPYDLVNFDWEGDFDRVYIWNPKTDSYEHLQIGVNNMASWDPDYLHPSLPSPTASSFGPELGIAIAWLSANPSGLLFIDKNVGDGRPISYFQSGTTYYTEKIARRIKADEWLSVNGYTPIQKGFVWVQGESDMSNTEAYYRTALDELINARITDKFIAENTIQIITQVPAGTGNYGAGVAAAKIDYVNETNRARLVEYTSNFNPDNIHLNTSGQLQLGMDSLRYICNSDSELTSDIPKGKSTWTE